MNLCDGYPEFGLGGNHPNIEFFVPYKEEVSRLRMLVRWLLGWLLLIPHIIILYLRAFVVFFIFIILIVILLPTTTTTVTRIRITFLTILTRTSRT